MGDADQDHQPGFGDLPDDPAVDPDRRLTDPLDHRTHGLSLARPEDQPTGKVRRLGSVVDELKVILFRRVEVLR
ncbi:hypothetical protein GCM10010439_10550 [Actinocorallia aurantiaca]|uniref:Uncharacterized protein n=1 Tax=Actinocorallia aurantiaca TaxID=46204 RepID=A0ABP6GEB1_9ACTN